MYSCYLVPKQGFKRKKFAPQVSIERSSFYKLRLVIIFPAGYTAEPPGDLRARKLVETKFPRVPPNSGGTREISTLSRRPGDGNKNGEDRSARLNLFFSLCRGDRGNLSFDKLIS